jgi:RNA polymerase sigma factor (sigma-70 family)
VRSSSHQFDKIVNEYKNMIFNLLFRLTGDYHLSEDLFQETFIKVYRSIKDFKQQAKLSTWIYSIAINVFKDHTRKRRWQLLKPSDWNNPIDTMSPEIKFIIEQEKENIQKKITLLKESIRIPIVLYYIQGLSISRIAEITGRTQTDIKVSLYRARKILKKGLENEK